MIHVRADSIEESCGGWAAHEPGVVGNTLIGWWPRDQRDVAERFLQVKLGHLLKRQGTQQDTETSR